LVIKYLRACLIWYGFRFNTVWRSWLRHSVTSQKVVGSIPDGFVGIFHGQNPSGHTLALGSTLPLHRNEHQEYFLWGKGGRCLGLTTLQPSCADYLEILELQRPGNLRACPGLYRDCFTSTLCEFLLLHGCRGQYFFFQSKNSLMYTEQITSFYAVNCRSSYYKPIRSYSRTRF
jgi:hypothetical protein